MSQGWQPLDELFSALADPTRRQILQRLVHDGPQTATQLAAHFPLTRQAVVKHVQTLARRRARRPHESRSRGALHATTERLGEAVTWLLDTGRHWDRRADRLRRRASSGNL